MVWISAENMRKMSAVTSENVLVYLFS